jgi:hypothetical protein
MKKSILVILLFSLLFTNQLLAQEQPMVSIPANQLTEQQKKQLEQKQTIETVSSWTGVGKELGDAVNGAVGALTKHAVDFSETKLGTFTMFLIAYKVLGRDILRLLIGLPLIFFLTVIFVIVVYKNGLRKRVLYKEEVYNKGKEDEYTEKKYETLEPEYTFMFVSAVAYLAFVSIFFITL